jgi:hypothetical protein
MAGVSRGYRSLTTVLAPAMLPGIAGAADWSMQSVAQVYAQAESNPQLFADRRHGAESGVIDGTLDLFRHTELLTIDINAHASTHRYSNDVGLDRDDQQAALSVSQAGETYVLRANGSITRDTTATSELGTTGIIAFNHWHRNGSRPNVSLPAFPLAGRTAPTRKTRRQACRITVTCPPASTAATTSLKPPVARCRSVPAG